MCIGMDDGTARKRHKNKYAKNVHKNMSKKSSLDI